MCRFAHALGWVILTALIRASVFAGLLDLFTEHRTNIYKLDDPVDAGGRHSFPVSAADEPRREDAASL